MQFVHSLRAECGGVIHNILWCGGEAFHNPRGKPAVFRHFSRELCKIRRGFFAHRYPPSTPSTCPVMNDARSPSRKLTARATSCGVPSRPSGVRVNCVAPGVIDTRMMDEHSAETKAALAEETPLGRLGTPQDVAQAAAFLVSDAAAFITGQVLGVDGGYL